MVAMNHLLASCVLVSEIKKREYPAWKALAVAVTGGALSHLLMDALPHLDPSVLFQSESFTRFTEVWWFAVVDNLVGFAIVGAWWLKHKARIPWWLMCAAISGCWGPDLLISAADAGHIPAWNTIAHLVSIHRTWHDYWIWQWSPTPEQIVFIRMTLGTFLSIVTALILAIRLLRQLQPDKVLVTPPEPAID